MKSEGDTGNWIVKRSRAGTNVCGYTMPGLRIVLQNVIDRFDIGITLAQAVELGVFLTCDEGASPSTLELASHLHNDIDGTDIIFRRSEGIITVSTNPDFFKNVSGILLRKNSATEFGRVLLALALPDNVHGSNGHSKIPAEFLE